MQGHMAHPMHDLPSDPVGPAEVLPLHPTGAFGIAHTAQGLKHDHPAAVLFDEIHDPAGRMFGYSLFPVAKAPPDSVVGATFRSVPRLSLPDGDGVELAEPPLLVLSSGDKPGTFHLGSVECHGYHQIVHAQVHRGQGRSGFSAN